MTPGQQDSEPSGQALTAGTRLVEFVIERVLGSGGFGITYLARDTSLNRQVVIKENLPAQFAWRETTTGTVRPRHTSGGDADDYEWSMKNFLREAETLASLDHPGIVRVLRKFEANGTAYFVMPFVEGVAFDTLIEERRVKGQLFSDEELNGLLDRLLDALGYLHDRGIYHRDIKPGNILISNQGVPALIDFGSARQRLSERSMTVVESAGYTPFEQLQSRGNVGPWSDLYALGATIVKAVTFGTLPKAADRVMDDPWQGLVNHPEASRRHSFPLLDSIDRAVQVAPANRWQDSRQWQDGLREGTKSSSSPPSAVVWPPAAPAYRPPPHHGQSAAISWLEEADEIAKSATVTAPALWNPTTAANLGVILTPAFGAFLHARNSKVLGRSAEGTSGMYWAYGMAACGFLGMLFAGSLSYFMSINLLVLILWYYISAKKQIGLVEAAFGKNYSKKSFGKPLFAGIGCLVAAVIFVEGLHSLVRGGAAPVIAGEVSSAVVGGGNEEVEDSVSLFNRGVAYANADGVAQDLAEAVRCYQKAADLGYLDAMNNLGACYDNGEGVAKNSVEAVKWYRKAAEQGNPMGQLNLGQCYENGTGVAQDTIEAAKCYLKAAENGNAMAQLAMANCYYDGRGVAKDTTKAAKWCRAAADQGYSPAQNSFGFCCQYGFGVAKDLAEAVNWYNKAAVQKNAAAQWNLGNCYFDGNGIEENKSEAVKWYHSAAESGYAAAQLYLGICYDNGEGATLDDAEAVKWYRKAAEQGNATAQLNLGACYDNGEGIIRDDAEAVKWYRKAAEQGNVVAQINLAACYSRGEGVSRDDSEAAKWYRKAAEAGDERIAKKAKEAIRRLGK